MFDAAVRLRASLSTLKLHQTLRAASCCGHELTKSNELSALCKVYNILLSVDQLTRKSIRIRSGIVGICRGLSLVFPAFLASANETELNVLHLQMNFIICSFLITTLISAFKLGRTNCQRLRHGINNGFGIIKLFCQISLNFYTVENKTIAKS